MLDTNKRDFQKIFSWTHLKIVQQHFGVFQRMVLLQTEHLPVKEGKASETGRGGNEQRSELRDLRLGPQITAKDAAPPVCDYTCGM